MKGKTCSDLIAEVDEATGGRRRRGLPRRKLAVGTAVVVLTLLVGTGVRALVVGSGSPPVTVPTTTAVTAPAPPESAPEQTPTTMPAETPTTTPTTARSSTTVPTVTPTTVTATTIVSPVPVVVPPEAPTTPKNWQAPQTPDSRYRCSDYRDLRAVRGVFSFQTCLVVYRDAQGLWRYQGLLAAVYRPNQAGGSESLSGKVWSVTNGAADPGHACPPVSFTNNQRWWCYSPTTSHTGPAALSARVEITDSRGSRVSADSPLFAAS